MKKKVIVPLFFVLVALFFLLFYPPKAKQVPYQHDKGQVFGTFYNIQYQQPDNRNLKAEILQRLATFDSSLSIFNDTSVIARINHNEPVLVDAYFVKMYEQAQQVSDLTHGAFDITVAPLVNAWGFGLGENKGQATRAMVDSLLPLVGYHKIKLQDGRLYKDDARIQLDASAIAKGYGCDVVAELLLEQGCENYLVDIGGEVVCRGRNSEGKLWSIGINKPIDDEVSVNSEIERVMHVDTIAMATSGNYRQFYYENGHKRAHTIDPRTGYPVEHNLLSVTVTASSCMRADAFATAFMVLGADSALAICATQPDLECFLICADGKDRYKTHYSKGFAQYLE